MKTKRIWMWSLVFGIVATFILYMGFFSNVSVGTSSSADKEEEHKGKVNAEQVSINGEETIAPRKMINPILQVSKGKRAISLKVVLEQGVSGYIEPGSYVDVIAYETTKKNTKEYKSATLILQNKKVLASGKSSDNEQAALEYETVTIEATPNEGVLLSLAAKDKDGFYFMLRNSEDKEIVKKGINETREVIKEGTE